MKNMKMGILLVCVLLVAGCGTTEKETKPETSTKEETVEEIPKTEPEGEQNPEKVEKVQVKIYHMDDQTEEYIFDTVELNETEPQLIWKELQKVGILSETSVLNSFALNKENSEMAEMDIGSTTGDYIRTKGTTGEEQVLNCLISTYADAYKCNRIKITENGNALETGHTILDGYIERK